MVFKAKGRNIVLSQENIDKLFKSLPTNLNAQKLMHDEYLYEEYPHYISQAITSITGKERKNINLTFLGGKYY